MALGNRTLLAPILMSEMVSYETSKSATAEATITAADDWVPVPGAVITFANAGNYLITASMLFESDGGDALMIGGIFVGLTLRAELHTNNLQRNTPGTSYMTSTFGFHWETGVAVNDVAYLAAKADSGLTTGTNCNICAAQLG
jgi:hypothetical protein